MNDQYRKLLAVCRPTARDENGSSPHAWGAYVMQRERRQPVESDESRAHTSRDPSDPKGDKRLTGRSAWG